MEWCKLVPELTVAQFANSLTFYTAVLGFAICFQREDPCFAYLEFEGSQLMIEEYHRDGWHVALLERPYGRGINFQIECTDAELIRTRLLTAGYPLYRDLRETWYKTGDVLSGSRELLVQDPDGYLLRFSQYLGEREIVLSETIG